MPFEQQYILYYARTSSVHILCMAAESDKGQDFMGCLHHIPLQTLRSMRAAASVMISYAGVKAGAGRTGIQLPHSP